MDDYNVILSKLFAQRDDKFRVFNEKIVNVKKDFPNIYFAMENMMDKKD